MKKILLIIAVVAVSGLTAWWLFFKEPVFNTTDGYLVNVDEKGLIIEGFDAVAYFTEDKAVKGDAEFSTKYEGATYWFASEENLELFKKEPQKYTPQYGAFCGYAVSIGKLRPVDPTIYQIENGRLILQHTQEAYRLFNKDVTGNIEKADKNWPGIVVNHAGKPVQYDKPATAPADQISSNN
jgi:YHS domain-containing protein